MLYDNLVNTLNLQYEVFISLGADSGPRGQEVMHRLVKLLPGY